jgi:hypothetical protein
MNKRKKVPFGRGKYNFRNRAMLGMPGMMPDNGGVDDKDIYDKINGEKVLREYGQEGLRNAIHLIISQP